jgi:hypothetical protein
MTVKEIVRALRSLHACRESVMWAGELWEGTTAQQAWDLCPRADWLLWLLARTGADRKLLTLAACACARTALPFVRADEDRPRIAIEWTESWARGEASMGEVRAAISRASFIPSYTVFAAVDAAADVITNAVAYAAGAAIHAADAAAAAADTAASYATHEVADTIRCEALARMADIVRGFFPHPPTVDLRVGGTRSGSETVKERQ